MSDRICLFAGTSEGRKLAGLLKEAADLTVCVATEYGGIMLDGIEGIKVHSERMDAGEMAGFFRAGSFDRIIDATHPYATAATENIVAAAAETGIPLMRILRENDGFAGEAVHVSSVSEARDYLAGRDGNILITTGAKELSAYAGLDMSRVWARVLPTASSLEECARAGIPAAHIIAAQGPFTEEMNLAQLRMIGAGYMVTKASGRAGGFDEKIRAALACGAVPVVIGQPPQTEGLSMDEAIRELGVSYDLPAREVTLIGLGPGSRGMMVPEARAALENCDAVIGAASVIEGLCASKPCFSEFLPARVKQVLDSHPSIRRAAVVFRGDTGFFSGASGMLKALEGEKVTVIPGLSSMAVLASRLGVSWNDAAWISVHGRDANYVSAVVRNRKLFILTGGDNTPSAVCRKLTEYGLGEVRTAVGERLSYPDERITRGSAEELSGTDFDSLSIMYVENPGAEEACRIGIDDSEFIRGDVPVTKSEVRAVSVAKLALKADSVIWDVGAGTGSVSVECALAAPKGRVYAIEKEEDALELIRKNRVKFRADNITVVPGTAPEALRDLPAPTHAFIGGSGGNLRGILEVLLEKNPGVRIVMNTITLESQAEASEMAREFGFDIFEAAGVNVSRSRKAGRYHLMMAQNPVTVFVMQKRTEG